MGFCGTITQAQREWERREMIHDLLKEAVGSLIEERRRAEQALAIEAYTLHEGSPLALVFVSEPRLGTFEPRAVASLWPQEGA